MIEFFGWSATIILTICAIPQFLKMYKTKSVKDISIWMWWLYLTGHFFALIYALLIKQDPLIAKYTINIFISVFIIISFFSYKNGNYIK